MRGNFNFECNKERGSIDQLYIELGVYENFKYTLYIKFLSKINIKGVTITYLEDQTPDESILLA